MCDLRVHILHYTNSYQVTNAARVKMLEGVADILLNCIS
jgi:hypothetical protein